MFAVFILSQIFFLFGAAVLRLNLPKNAKVFKYGISNGEDNFISLLLLYLLNVNF